MDGYEYLMQFIKGNAPYTEDVGDDQIIWEQTRAIVMYVALKNNIDVDTAQWDFMMKDLHDATQTNMTFNEFDLYMGEWLC